MKKKSEATYNERLFTNGLRGKLHLARFQWLERRLVRLQCEYESVLELGCHDGKVIDYLPVKPSCYLGFDANWEGGVDLASDRWSKESNYMFKCCETPGQMDVSGQDFDISICMETLEHVSPVLVVPYLKKLSTVTRKYLFVTMPNEIGVVFFFKYLTKYVLGGDVHSYTAMEFVNEVLGKTDKVQRNNHKGFNYNDLIMAISDYFEIIEISGHPLGFLPPRLNFGIGVIAKPRHGCTSE